MGSNLTREIDVSLGVYFLMQVSGPSVWLLRRSGSLITFLPHLSLFANDSNFMTGFVLMILLIQRDSEAIQYWLKLH